MDKEQAERMLENLKNREVEEIFVAKQDFMVFREVIVKREDFKYFRVLPKEAEMSFINIWMNQGANPITYVKGEKCTIPISGIVVKY